jgi:hypothetical protein
MALVSLFTGWVWFWKKTAIFPLAVLTKEPFMNKLQDILVRKELEC